LNEKRQKKKTKRNGTKKGKLRELGGVRVLEIPLYSKNRDREGTIGKGGNPQKVGWTKNANGHTGIRKWGSRSKGHTLGEEKEEDRKGVTARAGCLQNMRGAWV